MNQGRSVYVDVCSRSIRSVVGLINLQFQVRIVLIEKSNKSWHVQACFCSVDLSYAV